MLSSIRQMFFCERRIIFDREITFELRHPLRDFVCGKNVLEKYLTGIFERRRGFLLWETSNHVFIILFGECNISLVKSFLKFIHQIRIVDIMASYYMPLLVCLADTHHFLSSFFTCEWVNPVERHDFAKHSWVNIWTHMGPLYQMKPISRALSATESYQIVLPSPRVSVGHMVFPRTEDANFHRRRNRHFLAVAVPLSFVRKVFDPLHKIN